MRKGSYGRWWGCLSGHTLNPKLGTTDEVLAVLKVDNRVVGQTGWGQVAEKSWDQAFIISLDRVRLAFVWSGLAVGCKEGGHPGHG